MAGTRLKVRNESVFRRSPLREGSLISVLPSVSTDYRRSGADIRPYDQGNIGPACRCEAITFN